MGDPFSCGIPGGSIQYLIFFCDVILVIRVTLSIISKNPACLYASKNCSCRFFINRKIADYGFPYTIAPLTGQTSVHRPQR